MCVRERENVCEHTLQEKDMMVGGRRQNVLECKRLYGCVCAHEVYKSVNLSVCCCLVLVSISKNVYVCVCPSCPYLL